MSGRFQPEAGADSAQSLADAIATVENAGLVTSMKGRVGLDVERLARADHENKAEKMDGCLTDHNSFEEHMAWHRWRVEGLAAHYDRLTPFQENEAGAILPRCIACSEPADPNSPWCRQHRLRVEEEDRL